jgi:hypothetical protein
MVSIPENKIVEIAQELDAGMLCYYHIQTGELESYPDEMRHAGFEEEMWSDVIEKVNAHREQYILFEGLNSTGSFRVMETFVGNIADENTKRRFEDAIAFKKPFQNFKQLLHEYPALREEWFRFNEAQQALWVQEQLDVYNNSDG